MTMPDLLRYVLDDFESNGGAICWQQLHECMDNIQVAKAGGSRVSFITDAINPTEVLTGKQRYQGIVLWVPTEVITAPSTPTTEDGKEERG